MDACIPVVALLINLTLSSDAPCLNEMTSVMQCWKTNDFQDYKCAAEIKAFLLCSEKAVCYHLSYCVYYQFCSVRQ